MFQLTLDIQSQDYFLNRKIYPLFSTPNRSGLTKVGCIKQIELLFRFYVVITTKVEIELIQKYFHLQTSLQFGDKH